LQQDLDKLANGKANGKLLFIHKKCLVTRNKNPIKFNYTLHGHPLESLEEANSLLSTNQHKDFKWKSHVTNLCTKAN